jgi:hypothetical protein
MPNLGDYLGHILSEITIARMQADVEAVRVAELYSSHPLLRHMPIPHFRLPNVEIDIPVVIKGMEKQSAEASTRGAPSMVQMRKVFDTVLLMVLKEEGIAIKPEIKRRLNKNLDKKAASMRQPSEVSVGINIVADEFSRTALKSLTEARVSLDREKLSKVEERLIQASKIEFLKVRKPPSRVEVLIGTSEVRESGPEQVITRLHLKISEESFEWTTIESDGEKKDRLVIE